MTARPKVSVICLTYNQRPFVADALQGILDQDADFSVEVIVADDASTDGTPDIIREFASAHPDLFRPILRDRNLGAMGNLIDCLSRIQGDYLAFCEGDDYWTDPLKLSRQAAYLDQHPEASMCFHPVRLVVEGGPDAPTAGLDEGTGEPDAPSPSDAPSIFPPPHYAESFDLETLLARNFIQTNSVMYRRLDYANIPADVMPADHYLHVLHAIRGDIGFLDDVMGVYRRHPDGMWWTSLVDKGAFWRAYGAGHLALYREMLAMCGDEPRHHRIIADRIATAVALMEAHDEHSYLKALTNYPECLAAIARELPRHRDAAVTQTRLIRSLSSELREAQGRVAESNRLLAKARQRSIALTRLSDQAAAARDRARRDLQNAKTSAATQQARAEALRGQVRAMERTRAMRATRFVRRVRDRFTALHR